MSNLRRYGLRSTGCASALALALGLAMAACGGSSSGDDDDDDSAGDDDDDDGDDADVDGSGDPGRDGAPAADADLAGIWHPAPGTSWQWQLTGTIDTSFDVAMYDMDLFDVPDQVIGTLRDRGTTVICYFSAGSHEDWRDDAGDFPDAALGDPLDGWPGERWLDVRAEGVRTIMEARLDRAVARGCDGVEPDNVDGYANDTGFPLSASDQLDYLTFLAAAAHSRGLSVGLKNDLDQVDDLVDDFDWALNEECAQYDECDALDPFIAAGKAVFQVEYGGKRLVAEICPDANAANRDALIKNLDLDAERISCR